MTAAGLSDSQLFLPAIRLWALRFATPLLVSLCIVVFVGSPVVLVAKNNFLCTVEGMVAGYLCEGGLLCRVIS